VIGSVSMRCAERAREPFLPEATEFFCVPARARVFLCATIISPQTVFISRKMITALLAFTSILAVAAGDVDDSIVHVWDNVVTEANRQAMYHYALENCEEAGGWYQPFKYNPASPIEVLINSILSDLNDTSPHVEYWCRHEWEHVEVHADLDEASLEDNGEVRFPHNGHVLTLQVGSQIHGPTIVLENHSFGGELVDMQDSVSLVTIPSVEGRLTRFPGSWLHGVPRPTDVWLTGEPKEDEYDVGPYSKYGRSVLLFNTWTKPPSDLILPEEQLEELFTGQRRDREKNRKNKKCFAAPYQDWEELSIVPSSAFTAVDDKVANAVPAELFLMGSTKRKNYTEDSVLLLANEIELRGMLFDPGQPRSMRLWPYPNHAIPADSDGNSTGSAATN